MKRNLIDNADHGDVMAQASRASEELDPEMDVHASQPQQPMAIRGLGLALPGLAEAQSQKPKNVPFVKRKAVSSETRAVESTISQAGSSPDPAKGSPTATGAAGLANEFRRPSLPMSASRGPQITSLARPVYPAAHPVTGRPPSKSTSLPIPGPKPRAPSPALLQKMPSFERSHKNESLAPPAAPQRLNLKRKSVDDLRRLYEERAGTASALVEASRKKQ